MKRWFVLDINPEPWAIGDVGVRRHGGKLGAYVGRNQQLWSYQQAVKEQVRAILKRRPEYDFLEEGHFKITMLLWRRIDEYKTPQARTHRKHEADLTNMLKATEDALQGILFKNDKDTRQAEIYVVDQGPEVTGRIILCVEPIVGMFKILEILPEEVDAQISQLDELYAKGYERELDPWMIDDQIGF